MIREADIEKSIGAKLKAAGWLWLKFVSPGCSGVPDRIAVSPHGRIIFIELKTETGRLSAMQQVQIRRLRAHGQDVMVIYGMADAHETARRLVQYGAQS